MNMTKNTVPTYGANARIMPNGDVLIMGVIGDWFEGLDAATFTGEIRDMAADPIKVFINSPGGDVVDGLSIYNELASHSSRVEVTITALAASMASIIMLAGNTVRIPENGLIMIHNPWTVAVGDKNEFEKVQKQLEKMGESLVGIYARRTGQNEETIQAMMDAETWLSASEALDLGFVDEVLSDAPAADFANIDNETVDRMPTRMAAQVRSYQAAAKLNAPSAEDAATPAKKEKPMANKPEGQAAPQSKPAETETSQAAVAAAAASATLAETDRVSAILDGCTKAGLDSVFAQKLITEKTPIADARAAIIDQMAEMSKGGAPSNGHIIVGEDDRSKFLIAATAAIIHRAGHASMVKSLDQDLVNPGEFRSFSLADLARHAVETRGEKTHGKSRKDIVKMALTPTQGTLYQGTSDFTVVLENAMHKILQAAYAITPDTWRRFCKVGSVSDFRPHNRYRVGSFGGLDDLNENGEFKNKTIPDGEKASLTATTKGNIIALSRQAIINDDMGAFETLAAMFGRAGKLTIEKAVYTMLAENGGNGPLLLDGTALFDASRGNIGTAGVPSVTTFGEVSDLMAAQTAVGNTEEFLDLSPAILLASTSVARKAGVVNASIYDPDAANKLQRPNEVHLTYSDIVGTARLSGTPWYSFADPNVAPVLEVAFLDGNEEPFMEMQDGFRTDGVEWKTRLDFGVAGIDFRGAVKNDG